MNEGHAFYETTKLLFKTITIIYSTLFQKSTIVKGIRDAGSDVFGGDCDLHTLYHVVWEMLPNFCKSPLAAHTISYTDRSSLDQQVLCQPSPTDELFIDCIVGREANILRIDEPVRDGKTAKKRQRRSPSPGHPPE
jgi:hypothetical protein